MINFLTDNFDAKIIVSSLTSSSRIENITSSMRITTKRNGTPGILNLNVFLGDANLLTGGFLGNSFNVATGDSITVIVNSIVIFRGFVFTVGIKSDNTATITAYDYLRYFRNNVFVFLKLGCTALDIIAGAIYYLDFMVPCPQPNAASSLYKAGKLGMITYIDPSFAQKVFKRWSIHNTQTAVDLINKTINRYAAYTAVESDLYLGVFGAVEPPPNVFLFTQHYKSGSIIIGNALKAPQIIGTTPKVLTTKDYLTEASIEMSIDDEFYNSIVFERPDANKTEDSFNISKYYGVQDATSINKYGFLEKVERLPSTASAMAAAEIGAAAEAENKSKEALLELETVENKALLQKMLTYYNQVKYKYNVKSVGVIGIQAGDILTMEIPYLAKSKNPLQAMFSMPANTDIGSIVNLNGFCTGIIDSITHNFSHREHTMDLSILVTGAKKEMPGTPKELKAPAL